MAAVAYEIRDLVKRFRPEQPPANDGLSLDIYQGEVFGMLGPNGAGKTTLIRQMAGLSLPTSGSVRLFGHDLVRDPDRASLWVALQPQGFALPYFETCRSLLELTGQLRGLAPAAARREAADLLEELALTAHATKRFLDLSGGLRRLLAIGAALIGSRPVLMFDEPTNDLDPEVRRTVWQRIRKAAAAGSTVVLVTHNVVEAEQAMDRVAIVRAGRLLALGTPGELKARVARRVRLEVLFRPETAPAAADVLAGFPDVHSLGARRYAVVAPRAEAEQAMARLLPHLDLLDDFRIVTPNLEDVYLEMTGGETLAD